MAKIVFISFWCAYLIVLGLFGYFSCNFDYYKKAHSPKTFYFLYFVIAVYLGLGPIKLLFFINDVPIRFMWEQPVVETKITSPSNLVLPEGLYWYGCEITEIQEYTEDDMEYYLYSFAPVDMDGNGNIYQFSTLDKLDDNIPYILIMDSLTTNNVKDDQIVSVWARTGY